MMMPNPSFRFSVDKCIAHPLFEDLHAADKLNHNKDSYFDTNGDKKNID